VRYEKFFADLAKLHPDRVGFRAGYDEALAHLMEAGSDMFLMPSRYEPCGLNQMYSLRYGTIPIVHRTGGLADSVEHYDPRRGTGTGCVFNDFDVPGRSTPRSTGTTTQRPGRSSWPTRWPRISPGAVRWGTMKTCSAAFSALPPAGRSGARSAVRSHAQR